MENDKYYYCFKHGSEIHSTTSFHKVNQWFKRHPIDEEKFYSGEGIYIDNFGQYCCLTEEGLKEYLANVYRDSIKEDLTLIRIQLEKIKKLKDEQYSSEILIISKLAEEKQLKARIRSYFNIIVDYTKKLKEVSKNADNILVELEKEFPNLNIYKLYNEYFN